MGIRTWWTERHVAGALLLVGFALTVAGGWAFAAGETVAKAELLSAAMVVTALGLLLLEGLLRDAGERIFSRSGLVAFLLAAGLWLVGEAILLDGRGWMHPLERHYVLLSSFAMACFGGALLGTRLLSRWPGRWALGWGLLTFVVDLVAFVPPLVPNLVLLPIGIALLLPARSSS